MRRFIVILSLTLTVALTLEATQRWEEVSVPPIMVTQQLDPDDDQVVIIAKDGYIYVSSEKKVTVKIFTILGQLITQDTLSGGTYRFLMKTKGIYIVKIDADTHRVTI